jgi:hypothetical protein
MSMEFEKKMMFGTSEPNQEDGEDLMGEKGERYKVNIAGMNKINNAVKRANQNF